MKSLDDINIIVEKMENKFELSYQAAAKTISGFGDGVNKLSTQVVEMNSQIVELKTMLKDFVEHTNKILDVHDNDLKTLRASDTEIRSAFKSGKWVAGIAIFIILGLGGTITTLWANIYTSDQEDIKKVIESHEAKDANAVNRLIELLSKKNSISQSELNTIVNYAQ